MDISVLQKTRYAYKPKLPAGISGAVADIAIELGAPTESIGDQGDLRALFKSTYGKPLATFVTGKNDKISRELKVGVILSGGQAPGGH
ncbi:MAG: diphosphate--fructose-6-phosphate 1-phosphotransferase, partial [Treponema sp.]|nr:diphosphate--fructose-6-phosphate 1-phosphotransferase [Treponema sp.]